jgi:hypothetical protein
VLPEQEISLSAQSSPSQERDPEAFILLALMLSEKCALPDTLKSSEHSMLSPLLDPDVENELQRTRPLRRPLPLIDTLSYSPAGMVPLPEMCMLSFVLMIITS